MRLAGIVPHAQLSMNGLQFHGLFKLSLSSINRKTTLSDNPFAHYFPDICYIKENIW